MTTKVLSHNSLSLYGFYISALHSLCSGATAKKRRVDTREHTPYTCVPTGNTKTYLDLYVTFRTSTRDAPRRSGPGAPMGPPWGALFFIFYFPLLPAPLKPPGRTHTERSKKHALYCKCLSTDIVRVSLSVSMDTVGEEFCL